MMSNDEQISCYSWIELELCEMSEGRKYWMTSFIGETYETKGKRQGETLSVAYPSRSRDSKRGRQESIP